MRVLLVFPSIDCPPGVQHGLATISAVLKSAGHEVRLLHVCEHVWPIPTDDEIVRLVREFEPEVVGFSLLTMQAGWASRVARRLRAEFPGLPLVAGGVHCTMVPEEVTASGDYDFVCVGEGEHAFLELVRRLEAGEDATTCPNMWVPRPGREPARNPVGPFPDLAALPPHDFSIFAMDDILRAKNGWLSILTSRGCPYKCTYCFNKEIVDRYVEDGSARSAKEYLRHFPVERVIAEIGDIRMKYPDVRTVIFDDDLFTLDRRYVSEFCRAYRESGIGLPFVVNAHVACFDDEMAHELAGAGCIIVKVGLESGSARVRREILWRPMTNDKIAASFEAAHRHGLHTSAFVMFGLPTETRAEIEETIDLCARVKMGRFRWALFFPFPGTAGHRIAEDLGRIDRDRMAGLGNYFDGTCLKFEPGHALLVDKLSRLFSWWVNARIDWPSAPIYRELVAEVEAMDRETWEARKGELVRRDRELSDELMAADVTHYTIRYAHVMGVRSDYIQWERQRARSKKGEGAAGATLAAQGACRPSEGGGGCSPLPDMANEWNVAYTLD